MESSVQHLEFSGLTMIMILLHNDWVNEALYSAKIIRMTAPTITTIISIPSSERMLNATKQWF